MIRCENSEVLPAGSVAVTEMRAPASVWTGKRDVESRVAAGVVVISDSPSQVSPSTSSLGKLEHAGLE